uniref:GNAT family N-acetyltransferase n=1 Tax=Thaumasiovibrio occultus TaxID=1891184 RepID=UPI000B35830E|nr:GNAT family N-acetyltransferase [Thaumasiovibrio occultus]
MELTTPRLRLRCLQTSDLASLAAMHRDKETMRYFPSVLDAQQNAAFFDKLTALFAQQGWGVFAIDEKATGEFVGIVGLVKQTLRGIPNAPLLELLWRIDKRYWGCGYAPEAASACIQFAFEHLNETALYAYTAAINQPSQRVMEKLGMMRLTQRFDHPSVAKESPLCAHVMYRLAATDWQARQR